MFLPKRIRGLKGRLLQAKHLSSTDRPVGSFRRSTTTPLTRVSFFVLRSGRALGFEATHGGGARAFRGGLFGAFSSVTGAVRGVTLSDWSEVDGVLAQEDNVNYIIEVLGR